MRKDSRAHGDSRPRLRRPAKLMRAANERDQRVIDERGYGRGLRGAMAAVRVERRSHWMGALEHAHGQTRALSLSLPRRPRSREQSHGRPVRRTSRSTRAGPSSEDPPGEPSDLGEALAGQPIGGAA